MGCVKSKEDDFDLIATPMRELVETSFDADYITKFSKHICLDKIKIVCKLGQGSYAKVYLIE